MAPADTAPPRFIGYCRGSTADQSFSLVQQRDALAKEAQHRGIEIVAFHEELVSARATKRPRLNAALRLLKAGEVDGLMVTRLDRLARSIRFAGEVFEASKEQGWTLILLDPAVDTSTAFGHAFASVAAVFAQLESDLASQRTKDALAVKRSQGVVLGHPVVMARETIDRILSDHEYLGLTAKEITANLIADDVPTAQGGRWHLSTVQGVIKRNGVANA